MPLVCTEILGDAAHADCHERIHDLELREAVEIIQLPRHELARRRMKVVTDKGSECAIALPRSQQLFDGAVLFLDQVRAVVVRAEPESWLVFRASNVAAGLELGYFAGNMHWPVRFRGDDLLICGEVGAQHALERLRHLLGAGVVEYVGGSE
jgi:urease accessory protein